MSLRHTMDRFLRRLARHAARGGSAAAAASRSSPDMQPLPTPSVQYLAAAAAPGQPPSSVAPDAVGSNNDWDMSTLNSSLAENFTLFTDGASHDLTPTPDGHVTSDQAWPVSSFAVIKALVLIVILAILLVVSCKVTMQYIIKSSKSEKR